MILSASSAIPRAAAYASPALANPWIASDQIYGDREFWGRGVCPADSSACSRSMIWAPRICNGRGSTWSATRTVTSQPAIARSKSHPPANFTTSMTFAATTSSRYLMSCSAA